MTFLNPLYLFGLLAAGIPIVIHLLTRRRPKRVTFPSVEFLREVNVAQLRRFRLRELLLLALRTLAIALLALALSKPALKGAIGAGGGATSSVVVLVDRSASMAAVEGREALSARARARARAVLESLDAGAEVQVIAFDAQPEALFPQPVADLARAGAAIEAIEPRPFTTDLDGAVARGLAVLRRSSRVNKELYLLSDLQRAGLPGGADADSATAAADSGASSLGAAPSGLRFYVLPLAGTQRPENLAVTRARLRGVSATARPTYVQAQAGPGVGPGGSSAVDVSVQAFGGGGGEVAVGVRAAGGRELGRAFVPLGAGEGRALVPLSAAPPGGGEAFLPEDAFDTDNHRWFAGGAGGRIEVGIVEGGLRGSSPLHLALEAGQEAGQVAFRRLDSGTISDGSLAGLDVLVLDDVAELGAGALAAVVEYARGGGGVAVVLGPRARPAFYGARLFPALGTLRVGPAPRASGTGQWTLRLAAPGHAAFEGFPGRAGDAVTQASFRQAWPLVPGSGSRVLARFAPDLPALVEDGRLLVFASDAEGQWNDFPTRGAFLPLWLQSLRALAHGSASDDLVPGRRYSVAVPLGAQASDLRLVDPAGRPVALEQSLTEGRRRLVSAPLAELGLHRLEAGGRTVEEVAVNLDARESDLARMTGGQARARWVAYRPTVLEGDDDLARRIREGRFGREIAGLLLWLAFLCLVLESLVSRLMTPAPSKA